MEAVLPEERDQQDQQPQQEQPEQPQPQQDAPTTTQQPSPAPEQPKPQAPAADQGIEQEPSGDGLKPKRPSPKGHRRKPKAKARPKHKGHHHAVKRAPLRHSDGSPTRQNPGFVDALPGPSTTTGVPNFIIRKFRVPIFLLPIYQAAGTQYGIRWEVLAAINEIETDYGRNLNVSSAGALGWMQFMPSTWRKYGTDANKDGHRDPYNPVDAIFAAARYLKAAGYEDDVRRAIFAYNHADWYVDSVMLRARLIAGVPADLVGSLTGLTEGRFPVAARARYADDLAERRLKRVKVGQNAANLVESDDGRSGIQIYSRPGAPVIAVNDGVVKKLGTSPRFGHYVVLQDVYGNRYMYAHLGAVAKYYPVPKRDGDEDSRLTVPALPAHSDPQPTAPASAGSQPAPAGYGTPPEGTPGATTAVKARLFAHPYHPLAREAGGLEQLLEMDAGLDTYNAEFARPFGVDSKNVRLKRLRRGARLIGGTVLGSIGRTVPGKAAHLEFQIRPAGRGAPRIDPKPILDGWKLLEATAVYRASGRNVLRKQGYSVGQILMMPKPLLQRRVLGDERVEIYPCGRDDIRSGQIDRRVLATLEYLAETGFRPTVTALKCGHSYLTASGHVSEHSSGNAVDIAQVNGVPIMGHQERGGITEQTVRQLMHLQGVMQPHQIISLLDLGANTYAMGDHADHIHVGFHPRFGENRRLGRQALAVLKPGQWSELLARLRKIRNPAVATKPSRYSLPADRRRRRHDRNLHTASLKSRPVRYLTARPAHGLRPLQRLRPPASPSVGGGPRLRPLSALK
jgi:hypothetical protein